jgi:superfamily II DNA or RNA helicase
MPFEHVFDQHCAPDVAYFFEPEHVPATRVASEAFAPLFTKLFAEVTSKNPRRHLIDEKAPFFVAARSAQLRYLDVMLNDPVPHEGKTEPFACEVSLDQGWLGVMIGLRVYKGISVMQHPLRQAFVPLALKKPGKRGSTNPNDLSPASKTKAIEAFRHDLARGKLTIKMAPIPEWSGAHVRLHNNTVFQLQLPNHVDIWTDWEDLRDLEVRVRLPQETKGLKGLEALVGASAVETVRLACFLLRSAGKNLITMPKLSRGGGGSDSHVPRAMLDAFRFLQELSRRYPCVLQPAVGSKRNGLVLGFRILHYPMLLHLRRHTEQLMDAGANNKEEDGDEKMEAKAAFGHLCRPENRPIWVQQLAALQSMREQRAQGRRGFAIWLKTGAGKTSLPLEHISEEEAESGLQNLIYVVNMESLINIITQLQEFKQPPTNIKILVPIQDLPDKVKKTEAFRPFLWPWSSHHDEDGQLQLPSGTGNVFLITHDHLKHKAMGSLDAIASRSAVVVDEAHLAMAPSQRTQAALSLCSRAHMFYMMTGTPTLSSSLTGMAEWFALMVDFPVTRETVWLCIASAIFSDVQQDSRIEMRTVEAEFADPAEKSRYESLVPISCGGSNDGRKTSQQIAEALQICQVRCRQTVVQQAIDFTHESKTGGALILFNHSSDREEYLGYLKEAKIARSSIFVVGVDGAALELTDETVRNGVTPDYRFVLAPISSALGCQWSRLKAVFSSVIPANQAKRSQSGARLARPGQSAKVVPYVVVHIGLLSMLMRSKHVSAASCEQWVQRFAASASSSV